MPLPRCFFDVSINGVPTGRIVFELFKDDCPRTTENFRCLCTGEKGEGPTTFKPMHYKGTPIHRIVKGFIIQGGDFSNGDGTGGESIYGGMFKDESFKHKHDRPFLLSMANKGPNTNGSQFFITTRPAPHLDGIHVVFGRVVGGSQFVTEVENQKVDAGHRPYADIRITHSGELVLLKRKKAKQVAPEVAPAVSSESSSSEESDSESESESETDSEEERKRKRKRKLKRKKEALKKQKLKEQGNGEKTVEEKGKKKKKRKKKVNEEDEEKVKRRKKKHKEKLDRREKKKLAKKQKVREKEVKGSKSASSGSDEEEPVTSTVPELVGMEIPEDILADRTSWLLRRSRTPSPSEDSDAVQVGAQLGKKNMPGPASGKKGVDGTDEGGAPPPRKPQSFKPMLVKRGDNEVSNSGRILKGRGTMMYRTPPREGDSSDDLRSDLEYGRGMQQRWGGGMMMDREDVSNRTNYRRFRSSPQRGAPTRAPHSNKREDRFRQNEYRDRSPQREERPEERVLQDGERQRDRNDGGYGWDRHRREDRRRRDDRDYDKEKPRRENPDSEGGEVRGGGGSRWDNSNTLSRNQQWEKSHDDRVESDSKREHRHRERYSRKHSRSSSSSSRSSSSDGHGRMRSDYMPSRQSYRDRQGRTTGEDSEHDPRKENRSRDRHYQEQRRGRGLEYEEDGRSRQQDDRSRSQYNKEKNQRRNFEDDSDGRGQGQDDRSKRNLEDDHDGRGQVPGDRSQHYKERPQRRNRDDDDDDEHRRRRDSREQRHRQRSREGEDDWRHHGKPSATTGSKWSRHNDQDSEQSSSDEDKQIERAFQQKNWKNVGMEEDVFGLNKFLPVP